MFDSTIELITLVSSNSHLVFCFCNLLIGILFVSNSKSNPAHSEENICLPVSPKRTDEGDHKHEDGCDAILDDIETTSYAAETPTLNITKAGTTPNVVEAPTTEEEHINKGEDDKNDDEEDDDDELRRRAEEFIAKINRAWKAEKLGALSPSVHGDQLHGHFGGTLVM